MEKTWLLPRNTCSTPTSAARRPRAGRGRRLWDDDGKEYLDFFAGTPSSAWALPPGGRRGDRRAGGTLIHVSNIFYTKPQIELAQTAGRELLRRPRLLLQQRRRGERGGHQAGAQVRPRQPNGAYEIISHERLLPRPDPGDRDRHRQPKLHGAFPPLPEGFRYVPFNDVEAIEKAVRRRPAPSCSSPSRARAASTCPTTAYLQGRPGALRRRGHAADPRRGADGHGPDRASCSPTSTTASSRTS